MNPIYEEMNKVKQDHYDNARNDMLKAMYSFSQLDDQQKHRLLSEFVGAETVFAFYSLMQQYYA